MRFGKESDAAWCRSLLNDKQSITLLGKQGDKPCAVGATWQYRCVRA